MTLCRQLNQHSPTDKAMKIFNILLAILTIPPLTLPRECRAATLPEDHSSSDSTSAIIQKAQVLYSDGMYPKVIDILRASGIDTVDARASSLTGMSYSAMNDCDNAFDFLKRACLKDSANISYRFQLAMFSAQCGLIQEAEKEYRIIIELDSTFLPAFVRLGIIYNDQKLFDQAKVCFAHAITCNPRDYLSNYYMGTLLAMSSDKDSAMTFLKTCIQLNKGFVPAIDVLASLLYAQKDFYGALELYQKASAFRPTTPDYLYKVGLCYRQLKEYDTAIVYLRKAAAIDTTNAGYFAQLAYCYYFKEQYDSSITYGLKAISIDDENYTYYTNLALSYQKLNSEDGLIRVYKKMIDLHHPDDIAGLYFQIAMEYSPQKQTSEAVDAYRRALAIKPYYPSALFALGECYEIAGNISAARKTYEQFIQQTASDSTENIRRGSVKYRLKKLGQ